MIRTVIFLLLLLTTLTANARETVQTAHNMNNKNKKPEYPLTVQYPCQGKTFKDAYPSMFVYGKVTPPQGKLKINGAEVEIYKTGAYLAYIPTRPGDFDINLEFDDGKQTHYYKRAVNIQAFDYRLYEDGFGFDANYLYPKTDILMTNEDTVDFTAYGSPGRRVKMSLGPHIKNIEMKESPVEPGVYKQTLAFNGRADFPRPVKAVYVMHDERGRERSRVSSEGKIRIVKPQKAATAAKVKVENARIRPLAKTGRNILDTKLFGNVQVTGLLDNFYRVNLAGDNIGWIESSHLEPAKQYSLPKNQAGEITAVTHSDKTVLTIKNTARVSFKAEEKPKSFDITLYYTEALNAKAPTVESSLVKNIEFKDVSKQSKKITLNYKHGQVLWGQKSHYRGDDLIFELYHKPTFLFTKDQPLKDLRIFVDPGHSPVKRHICDGTISPGGVMENIPNYKIAAAAVEKLKMLGAAAALSKKEDEQLGLLPRTDRAKEYGAQIFVSVHNNSLPNNINPFARERGFGMYYYYPHSIDLAQAMDRSYIKNIPILPSGGIIEMDLSVTRNSPQIPAILIENVFMIFPAQEELLLQDSFIDKLARAITEGVVSYVNPAAAKLPNFGMPKPKPKPAHKTVKPRRKSPGIRAAKPGKPA
jgi:N-acetylmuramoyl-L-alanine amidase